MNVLCRLEKERRNTSYVQDVAIAWRESVKSLIGDDPECTGYGQSAIL